MVYLASLTKNYSKQKTRAFFFKWKNSFEKISLIHTGLKEQAFKTFLHTFKTIQFRMKMSAFFFLKFHTFQLAKEGIHETFINENNLKFRDVYLKSFLMRSIHGNIANSFHKWRSTTQQDSILRSLNKQRAIDLLKVICDKYEKKRCSSALSQFQMYSFNLSRLELRESFTNTLELEHRARSLKILKSQ